MKTSISLEHGVQAGLTYAESAKILKSVGFGGIDLDLTHNQSEPEKVLSDEWMNEALSMAKAARDAGLEIAQSHLPYYPGHLENPGDGSDEAFEAFMLPMYEQGLKACKLAGCKIAVKHPYYHLNSFERTVEGNVRLIRRLLCANQITGGDKAVDLRRIDDRHDAEGQTAAQRREDSPREVIFDFRTRRGNRRAHRRSTRRTNGSPVSNRRTAFGTEHVFFLRLFVCDDTTRSVDIRTLDNRNQIHQRPNRTADETGEQPKHDLPDADVPLAGIKAMYAQATQRDAQGQQYAVFDV